MMLTEVASCDTSRPRHFKGPNPEQKWSILRQSTMQKLRKIEQKDIEPGTVLSRPNPARNERTPTNQSTKGKPLCFSFDCVILSRTRKNVSHSNRLCQQLKKGRRVLQTSSHLVVLWQHCGFNTSCSDQTSSNSSFHFALKHPRSLYPFGWNSESKLPL